MAGAFSLLAIGASTGGPPAIQAILRTLRRLPVPVVIAQHMPPVFTRLFAERLHGANGWRVKEAEAGEILEPGSVYVAPGGVQLELMAQETTRYSSPSRPEAGRQLYTPSVDRLFVTAARLAGARLLAVLLTGMGDDGKAGMREVKARGGRTIAESEETAVVYGMPGEAARAGLVDRILPLPAIAGAIADEYLKSSPRPIADAPPGPLPQGAAGRSFRPVWFVCAIHCGGGADVRFPRRSEQIARSGGRIGPAALSENESPTFQRTDGVSDMSKYKIAWLPGDGVGIEVMEATRIVLDRLGFDAEYLHGDIGWEFWCKEGDAFPQRTIELLKQRRRGDVRRHHLEAGEGGGGRARARAARQGPRLPLADRPDAPDLRPLHLPAPLQGLPRQSAELQGGDRHRGVPREHRGPLRRRRVRPVPTELRRRARQALEAVRALRRPSGRRVRHHLQDQHAEGLRADRPRRLRVREEVHGRKKVTMVHKANVVRATEGLFLETGEAGRQGVPRHRRWTTPTSTPSACGS